MSGDIRPVSSSGSVFYALSGRRERFGLIGREVKIAPQMKQARQTLIRWQPLLDLPETPCADFRLESSEDRKLVLIVRYSWITGTANRDVRLRFSDVLAFRTHWDGDAPSVGRFVHAPRCNADPGFIWPLLIVQNSEWLSSGDFAVSCAITESTHKEPWSQYSVISLERSVDILARGVISADWIPGSRGSCAS